MGMFEGLLVFLSILLVYFVSVFILHKKGVLKKYNLTFWGPALMWRTEKGLGFLKRIAARKRFWKAFGSSGIILCFIMMIVMMTILVFQAWVVAGFNEEQKAMMPGPEIALVLPGINPVLPLEFLGYIVFALVVAVVVHEFSHGILAFAGKLKVKSLGVLYLIIPIGAFCEPDEKELRKTSHQKRMRVFAAGPLSNFVVVIVCIFLFSFVFMSSVQSAEDGVSIFYVLEDSPAEEIGIAQGMIISGINGTTLKNVSEYLELLDTTKAGQRITVSFAQGNEKFTKSVVLADKYNYTENISHMGVGFLGLGASQIHSSFLDLLKNPFSNFPDGFTLFYFLPLLGYFQGYNPIVAPFTDSFTVVGPLSFIPSNVFWVVVNTIYWVIWLNLALALFNVVPMIPLDGGYMLKDAIDLGISRIKKSLSDEKREKIVMNISFAISLVILFLIIFPWLIKYI